jgi:hypothetical protein
MEFAGTVPQQSYMSYVSYSPYMSYLGGSFAPACFPLWMG